MHFYCCLHIWISVHLKMSCRRMSKSLISTPKRLVTKSKSGPLKPQESIWYFSWNHETCPEFWIVWIMPTEDYGAWFQFDLARFFATPALDLKQTFLSILPKLCGEYKSPAMCCILHFFVNIWKVISRYIGSSWSLSIYFVFRFQIKFSGNCRADLMASFRVRQSETAPTWLLSLCLPTNCFPPPPTNFNSNSPQKYLFLDSQKLNMSRIDLKCGEQSGTMTCVSLSPTIGEI